MTAADRVRVRRIADGIVTAHASYRRRVRWAVVAGAAVVVTVALPSALLLNRPREFAGAAIGGATTASEYSTSAPVSRPRTLSTMATPAVDGTDRYAVALRQWRPSAPIRIYRASTTALLRAELRQVFGSRVHFVATTRRAAVLRAGGTISFPPASSAHGSNS